jgi:hypothetical protein
LSAFHARKDDIPSHRSRKYRTRETPAEGKLCFTLKGGERPKDFSTKAGTEDYPILLLICRREKVE